MGKAASTLSMRTVAVGYEKSFSIFYFLTFTMYGESLMIVKITDVEFSKELKSSEPTKVVTKMSVCIMLWF